MDATSVPAGPLPTPDARSWPARVACCVGSREAQTSRRGVMPLESIALIGGALLGVVLAAMIGSLLGRRFRTWREARATPLEARSATPSAPTTGSIPPAFDDPLAAVSPTGPAGTRT